MLLAAEVENATCRSKAEPVAIWKARKYIEEHSGEELSLPRVAKAVNIHPNYLSEKFKQVTGINFVEYVAGARFNAACDLLRNGNLRVSEIAFAVGFQSLSQFNRVFKKFSGKSPTQYREAESLTLPRVSNLRTIPFQCCETYPRLLGLRRILPLRKSRVQKVT